MTGRARRVVLAGAAAVVGAVLFLRGAPALRERVGSWRDAAEGRIALAVRARAEVAGVEPLERRALGVRSRFDSLVPRLVAAGSRAEGLASLGALVEHRVALHRARVLETHTVPDSAAAGKVERVTVRILLESDFPGLVAALRAIESGAPVVELRSVRLHRADPGADPSVEVLQAEAVLSAWLVRLPGGEG